MSKAALSILVCLSAFARAQAYDFKYVFEQPVQIENYVFLKWTMMSGSTCNGITIEHSTDSIRYEAIGSIDGVCGSSNVNVLYDFTDNSPVANSRNYYRLVFNQAGISESLSVFVVILNGDGVLVIPNPVREKAVIYFDNDKQAPLDFRLYDYSGKLIYSEGNLTEEKYEISSSGFPQGMYLFHLKKENEIKASGRIMILR